MSINDQIDSMVFTDSLISVQARPNDLDVQGHVNNAVVIEYLEIGRWDWFARLGLAPDRTVAPVVARLEIDYLAQITHTRVEVATRFVTPNEQNIKLTRIFRAIFRQEIRVPDLARPAARVLVTIAFADQKSNGRPVPLSQFLDRATDVKEG